MLFTVENIPFIDEEKNLIIDEKTPNIEFVFDSELDGLLFSDVKILLVPLVKIFFIKLKIEGIPYNNKDDNDITTNIIIENVFFELGIVSL